MVIFNTQVCQVFEGPKYSTTREICMLDHKETGISIPTTIQPSKFRQRFANDLYSIKRIKFEQFSQQINVFLLQHRLHYGRKINRKLAFPDTVSKRKNGNISVLTYRKPTHTDQYSSFNSNHQICCKLKCHLFFV